MGRFINCVITYDVIISLKHWMEISRSEMNDFDWSIDVGDNLIKKNKQTNTHGDTVMASSACPLSGLRLLVGCYAQTARLQH